jgi:hypothetical protein
VSCGSSAGSLSSVPYAHPPALATACPSASTWTNGSEQVLRARDGGLGLGGHADDAVGRRGAPAGTYVLRYVAGRRTLHSKHACKQARTVSSVQPISGPRHQIHQHPQVKNHQETKNQNPKSQMVASYSYSEIPGCFCLTSIPRLFQFQHHLLVHVSRGHKTTSPVRTGIAANQACGHWLNVRSPSDILVRPSGRYPTCCDWCLHCHCHRPCILGDFMCGAVGFERIFRLLCAMLIFLWELFLNKILDGLWK